MPPYRSPEVGTRLNTKFIRVERNIFVGKNNHDHHQDIVRLDNLEEAIARMEKANPDEVDAGWVGVRTDGDILIFGESVTLKLPVPSHSSKAREITKRDFAQQSPDRTVLELQK